MPEVTDQPAKPVRTWRPMALWIAGILLALGVLVCLSGCAPHRSLEQDARTSRDESLPMAVRMAAFERVMAGMTKGTRDEVVYRYLQPDTTSRIADPEHGDTFSAHIEAPDGTERWITIHNGKVRY